MGLWTADGQRLGVLEKPKTFAFLAYLSCHPDRDLHPRDSLLATFWPDADPKRAGACLRQTVHVLRKALPTGLIVSHRRSQVGVRFGLLECDVRSFWTAVAGGRLEEAAEVYRGEFLGGFSVAGAPELNRWVDALQQGLRRAAVDVVRSLAQSATKRGCQEEALRWWSRVLDLAPYDEAAATGTLVALGALGRLSEALQRSEAFVRRRTTELGIPPGPRFMANIVRTLGQEAADLGWISVDESTPDLRTGVETPTGRDHFGLRPRRRQQPQKVAV
jgi:DNA-binding SARP family transcriptional activator